MSQLPALDEEGIPWSEAIKVAWTMIALLSDLCTRISVGGSLRRSKPRVGDIEIIAMPDPEKLSAFDKRCDLMLAWGWVRWRLKEDGSRIAWSERFKAGVFDGMPLDLFIVRPDRQWGPTAIIRTGGYRANRCLVTTAGVRNREGDMGILPKELSFDGGVIKRDGVTLDTPEEWDVYEAIGLPWVPPRLRSVETYQKTAADFRGQGVHRKYLGAAPEMHDWGWARRPDGRWAKLDVALLRERQPEVAQSLARLEEAGTTVKQESMF